MQNVYKSIPELGNTRLLLWAIRPTDLEGCLYGKNRYPCGYWYKTYGEV